MVRLNLQIRSEELFARWFCVPAWRLNGHKDYIRPRQGLRIVAPQHPSLLTIVLIERAKAGGLLITPLPHAWNATDCFKPGGLSRSTPYERRAENFRALGCRFRERYANPIL